MGREFDLVNSTNPRMVMHLYDEHVETITGLSMSELRALAEQTKLYLTAKPGFSQILVFGVPHYVRWSWFNRGVHAGHVRTFIRETFGDSVEFDCYDFCARPTTVYCFELSPATVALRDALWRRFGRRVDFKLTPTGRGCTQNFL